MQTRRVRLSSRRTANLSTEHRNVVMTHLSLFMTSTGVFCFIPISQRLVESGIIPASDSLSWQLLSFLIPRLYRQTKEKDQIISVSDVKNPWSETETSPYLEEDTLVIDQLQAMKYPDEWKSSMASPSQCQCATIDSPLHSPFIDTFYGHESTNFLGDSDTTLCDSCDSLLRHEIPPAHIPSVIRVLALFEAQDQLHGVGFSEYEIVALTDAFSMLRL